MSAPRQSVFRFARFFYWLLVTAMAALPLILVIAYRAELLTIGSESLAYRFFYGYRILHGESGNIYFPQGYLLSALQNLVLVLSGAVDANTQNLRWALNYFSIATLAINTTVLVSAVTIASLARGITWIDRVMLAVIALGPMYATSGQGFQHSLWPDYYHLNVAISALSLALFQLAWRRPELGQRAIWAFAAGAFLGLATANKITAGVCGVALVLVLVSRPGLKISQIVAWIFLAGIGGLIGCALPILSFYGFKLAAALEASHSWLAFLRNPGGDEGFYEQIPGYFISNHLALFVGLYLASLLLSAIDLSKRLNRMTIVIFTALAVLGIGLIYSVIKRPAGTSVFEAAVFLGCFGAIMLTILPPSRPRTAIVVVFGAAFAVASTLLFPWKANIDLIAASKEQAEVRWSAFHLANDKAKGRPIIFFIPDNRYQAQDLFIALLKGTADFPTWTISAYGRPALEHFAPGLEFRTRYSNAMRQVEFERSALYVWNETPGLPPVQSFFPELDAALRRHEANVEAIDLKTGQRFLLLDVNGH